LKPKRLESPVLIIDADCTAREQLLAHLQAGGYRTAVANDGDSALMLARNLRPQLILCDANMTGMSAANCCRALRAIETLPPFHFIVLSTHEDKPRMLEAFDAGADDFLSRPLDPIELLARVKAAERTLFLEDCLERRVHVVTRLNMRLKSLNQKLEALATRDALTGLFNRREAMTHLRSEIAASRRYNQPLTCALIDIDQFKIVNDTAGHLVGDTAIRHVSNSLLRFVRDCDQVYRLGGDEFLVLFPNTTVTGAMLSMERFRATITTAPIEEQGWAVDISVSIGVADLAHRIGTPEDFLARADTALDAAKQAGRNTVRSADAGFTPLAGLAS
jgi:two-component system, cell cycle response regulator